MDPSTVLWFRSYHRHDQGLVQECPINTAFTLTLDDLEVDQIPLGQTFYILQQVSPESTYLMAAETFYRSSFRFKCVSHLEAKFDFFMIIREEFSVCILWIRVQFSSHRCSLSPERSHTKLTSNIPHMLTHMTLVLTEACARLGAASRPWPEIMNGLVKKRASTLRPLQHVSFLYRCDAHVRIGRLTT